MRRILTLVLLVMALGSVALGQQGNTVTIQTHGAPTGSCSGIMRAVDIDNNLLYFCSAATWYQAIGGGVIINSAGAVANDVLTFNDPTHLVAGVPGVPVLAANSGAGPITLTCDTSNTGNENHILPLTNAGAISVTGCTPGTNLHNGTGIYLDVQGAAAVVTYTPGSGTCNGAATCSLTTGLWRLFTESTETNTYARLQLTAAPSSGIPTMTTSGQGTYWPITVSVPGAANSPGAITANANVPHVFMYYSPITYIPTTVMVHLATVQAASHCDFGVYSIGATTLTLVWHTGSIDCNNGGVAAFLTLTPSSPPTVTGGKSYYWAQCTDTATVAFDTFSVPNLAAVTSSPAHTWGKNTTDTCTAGVLPGTMTIANIANDNTNNPAAAKIFP